MEQRGHPRLRARHMPFAVDANAAQRWLELMDNAFGEATLPPDAETVLRNFFRTVAVMVQNRP
jgi:hemoglobin